VSRESSLEKWQEIIEQGYPDDDILFDLIELHHTWQSGASLNPLLFLSRWESELNQNSDYSNFLFNQLEAFAIASNDYKLIKELYRLDPANLRISKKSIDQYLAQSSSKICKLNKRGECATCFLIIKHES